MYCMLGCERIPLSTWQRGGGGGGGGIGQCHVHCHYLMKFIPWENAAYGLCFQFIHPQWVSSSMIGCLRITSAYVVDHAEMPRGKL